MTFDFHTIIAITFLIVTYWILHKSRQRNKNFSTTLITAVIIGLAIGLFLQTVKNTQDQPIWTNETIRIFELISKVYLNFLKFLTIPIISIFIIKQLTQYNDNKIIAKIATHTIIYLTFITIVAGIIGIIVGKTLLLGANSTNIITQLNKDKLISSNNIVTNPFIYTIIFSLIGAFIMKIIARKIPSYDSKIRQTIDNAHKYINKITLMTISFMPYSIIPLFASSIASKGIKSIISVIDFTFALYLGAILLFIFQLSLLKINKLNTRIYLKNSMPPLVLGFISCSSIATLPLTIDNLQKKNGVSASTANFIATYGANANLSACSGLYPALMAITLANMIGKPVDFSFCIQLILIIALASISLAGIPGAAIISVSFVLSTLGMSEHLMLLASIIAIDPILDMGRTLVNINGVMTSAICIDNKLNLLNKKVYNQSKKSS
ncbi:MAG: cation:dicarboxylate symporter family transporter [Lentisphaeria bacterium]